VSNDNYLIVNGVKTEHKVHTEPTISVIDGYVAVNGVKTEYKVHTEPQISVIDGYIAINGIKTDFVNFKHLKPKIGNFACNYTISFNLRKITKSFKKSIGNTRRTP
jgi:hypothetical protein